VYVKVFDVWVPFVCKSFFGENKAAKRLLDHVFLVGVKTVVGVGGWRAGAETVVNDEGEDVTDNSLLVFNEDCDTTVDVNGNLKMSIFLHESPASTVDESNDGVPIGIIVVDQISDLNIASDALSSSLSCGSGLAIRNGPRLLKLTVSTECSIRQDDGTHCIATQVSTGALCQTL
jgi:hypothetical protein